MVSSSQCFKKYGDPILLATQSKFFELWLVPVDIQTAFKHVRFSAVGTIGFPKKIFLNEDLQPKLEAALRALIACDLASEMTTWDGCFMIRSKRALSSLSLHSWAIAVDINAFENRLHQKPKLSAKFVKCFTDNGFDWGGACGSFLRLTYNNDISNTKLHSLKINNLINEYS